MCWRMDALYTVISIRALLLHAPYEDYGALEAFLFRDERPRMNAQNQSH